MAEMQSVDLAETSSQDASGVSDQLRRVLRNASYLLFAQIAARGLGLVYLLLLTRWLPVDQFGHLNLAISMLMVADTVADLGLNRLIVRDLSRDPGRISQYVGSILPLKLIASGLVYAALVGFIAASNYPLEMLLVTAIAGASLLLTSPSLLFEAVLHSQQRFAFVSAAHILLSIVQVSAGVAAILLDGQVKSIAATFVLTNFVYLSVVLHGVRGLRVTVQPRVALDVWLTLIRASLPYATIAIILVLSFRLELILLGWFHDAEELARYGVALRLLEAGLLAVVTLGSALSPQFAKLHVSSREELTDLYLQVLRLSLLLGCPASVAGAILADPVIMLILPNEYTGVGDLLWILFLAFPFTAVYYLNFTLMVGADRQVRTAVLVAALCLAQFLIGLSLIPLFGATGAATAWATTSVVASLVSSWFVCRLFLHKPPLLRAILPALSGWAFMGGIMFLWPDGHAVLALMAALVIYGLVAAGLTVLLPLRPSAVGSPLAAS